MGEKQEERGLFQRFFGKETATEIKPRQKTLQELLPIFSDLSEIPLRYADKQAALNRITELCRQAMGSHACTLALVDLTNNVLIYGAGSGPNAEFEQILSTRKAKIGSGHSMDRGLIAKGEAVERYHLRRKGQGIANPHVARKYNLNAGLCYPLKSNHHLLGYLNHCSETLDRFSTEEKNLLKIFADQAVNVIERFDDYQRREQFSKVLNEMSVALLSFPVDEFFRQVCEKACELLEVPVCIVWIFDEKENQLKVRAATDNVDEAYRKLVLNFQSPTELPHLRQGELGYIENVATPPPEYHYQHPDEARQRGWVALLKCSHAG